MIRLISTIRDWNRVVAQFPRQERLGLVPTMGALHRGHGALFDEARRRCSVVVASIFVNPLQFNQASDYSHYPRTLEEDTAFCAAHGVDYIFAPTTAEMYRDRQQIFVEPGEIADHLCGRHRPGHFRGVATVVLKLFQIIRPRIAFFGEKDYQQLAIVRRMVMDLSLQIRIAAVPTVRESDGLALSSRNRLLSKDERALAPRLFLALLAARLSIASGERDAAAITDSAARILEDLPGIGLEYFDLVDPDTIQPIPIVGGSVRAALAAWIGGTRLIDNLLCAPPLFPCQKSAAHPTKVDEPLSSLM
jgi:pantoate ligase/cytidylate kinase